MTEKTIPEIQICAFYERDMEVKNKDIVKVMPKGGKKAKREERGKKEGR